MLTPLADSRHATRLARPLARFELLLNAAVGIAWGPLLFHFVRHVADWSQPWLLAGVAALTFGLGALGARVPASYFRTRPWEQEGAGRVYVRYFGIRVFKRWMSHGDWMNAWLRRRVPEYRVVRPSSESVAAYAARTMAIERAHLAWGLAALPILAYALEAGAYEFAALWSLVNALTNGWPILLQRYNRIRAEQAARRKLGGADGSIHPPARGGERANP
jgi:hypothetical protein